MKKIAAILLIIVIFTSCAQNNTVLNSENAVNLNEKESEDVIVESLTGYDTNLKAIRRHDYYKSVAFDSGFYIIEGFKNRSNLTFLDINTMQQVFVCSTPNCTHSDETCKSRLSVSTPSTGDIGGYVANYTLNNNNTQLLLQRNKPQDSGQTITEFISMDLTMENAQTIYETTSYSAADMIAISEKYLYFTIYQEENLALSTLNLETFESEVLIELPLLTYMKADFYPYEDSIYIVYEIIPDEYAPDPNNIDTFFEQPEEFTFAIDKLNVATGELTNEYSQNMTAQDSTSGMMYKGNFYFHDSYISGDITKLDLTTKEKTVLGTVEPSFSEMGSFIDGYLSFLIGVDAEKRRYYSHVNVDTGEITDVTLTYVSNTFGEAYNVEYTIFGEIGDKLLVSVGQTIVNEFISNTYALISKEDYFANNANYTEFDSSAIIENTSIS